ncbi:hypothetical protein N825_33975 [Skermanella stibiiresistens SB22]|uniref:Uncharacterized protein n=1 Tax=Skermanella stibiiresistens SB22 TaxID=1385369 RepID=W9HAQ5_9PROT|nr:hypothetical protein [Skermanella stibiiresistens]EWY40943.1 hypothetical protein N825_33975 [Skermanella stibiiresistens SB22]
MVDDAGRLPDLLCLSETAKVPGSHDMTVHLCKSRGSFEPIRLRLVIRPKPPEAVEGAVKVTHHVSGKGQHHAIGPRTLAAVEQLVVITLS